MARYAFFAFIYKIWICLRWSYGKYSLASERYDAIALLAWEWSCRYRHATAIIEYKRIDDGWSSECKVLLISKALFK